MTVAVVLLSIVLMLFMAVALAVQRAIRALGPRKSGEPDMPGEARAQTVIVLGVYLRWVNIAFLLAMAVYLIISRASAWYYGAAIIALCWIGSLLVGTTTRLQPHSSQMVALLVADLERRRQWYQAAHNTAYLSAVEDLLSRVRSGTGMHTARSLRR